VAGTTTVGRMTDPTSLPDFPPPSDQRPLRGRVLDVLLDEGYRPDIDDDTPNPDDTGAVARSLAWQAGDDASAADSSYFPNRFRVYDREGARCARKGCAGHIRRIVQSGRSTFYCPVCQK